MSRSLSIIFTTSSGHTEFVVDRLIDSLHESLKNDPHHQTPQWEGTSQKSPHARKQAKISRGVSTYVERNFGEADEAGGIFQRFLHEENNDLHITKQRAELTKPENLKKSDILLLACGTWNTGNVEGQLQPYMHELLSRAQDIDLTSIAAAAIGLGDDRYHFTARAADRLTDFLKTHNANLLLPALKIINEPFDQTKKIETWAKEFSTAISKLPAKQHS